jgi:hypothetical protein
VVRILGSISYGKGGGIFNNGNMILDHFTVAQNSSEGGGPFSGAGALPGLALGGGIFTTNGSAALQNTILAGSSSGSNDFGVLIDNGNNLSSDSSCQFNAAGSMNNTDPRLSPLVHQ